MKKILSIVYAFTISYSYAQLAVVNDKLVAQLEKNQIARKESNNKFMEVYGKAKDIYEEAGKKSLEIMAIHEMIYQQLYNVNSLFKQGKRMKYIWQTIGNITKEAKKVSQLSFKYPQYAGWIHEKYEKLYPQALSLQQEITQVALKPNKKTLMDPYDRDLLIQKIQEKLETIELQLISIRLGIEFSRSRAYILSVPVLGDYVSQDQMIVRSVLSTIKDFKYY
ncbi:hypothetical protein [Ornithobacterium rhinotracheale]|uniref:hypothetical protein n=1 Tax=Ornithobacterium rhinotracheale TaxID=28251 RepID=UPI00403606F0